MDTETLEKRAAYNRRLNMRGFRWARKGFMKAPDGAEMDFDTACEVLDEWEAVGPDLSYDRYKIKRDTRMAERENLRTWGVHTRPDGTQIVSGALLDEEDEEEAKLWNESMRKLRGKPPVNEEITF